MLDYTPIVNLSAEHLPALKKMLSCPSTAPSIATQFGQSIPPFGAERLCVVDFVCTLVQQKNDLLSQRVDELEVPRLLLDLMQTYYMNSMLHAKIFGIFSEAMHSNIDYLVCSVSRRYNLWDSLPRTANWRKG